MNEIRVPIKASTALRLHELAAAQGISMEQEASQLLDGAVKREGRLQKFIAETEAFAANLPPQVTDSADLIREDRDNR